MLSVESPNRNCAANDFSNKRIYVQSIYIAIRVHVSGGNRRAVEQNVDKRINIQAIHFTVTVDIAAQHFNGPHVDPG